MSLYAGLVTEDDIDYADDFIDAVWADLKGDATDDETDMLHENPVGWFRALRSIKKKMHHGIYESRTRVRATLNDDNGKRDRAEQFARRAGKFHVIGKAEERRQYVIRLIGDEGLTTACIGTIVDDIARALDILRESGMEEATAELERLARGLLRRKVGVPA